MREVFKMIIVLAVLSSFSGGLLASLKDGTKEKIENQELELVKGPAISNRFKILDRNTERSIFIGVFNGKANTVAFEMFGKGFADKFGIVIAINLDSDTIMGVELTTHKETPGLGANAKDDPSFSAQFKNIKFSDEKKILLSKDGGNITAISGATITSRAVCNTINNALTKYIELKPMFIETITKLHN